MPIPTAFVPPDTTHPGQTGYADVTIASGASLSAAVDLGAQTLVGVLISASWTAAGLSFQGSPDGVTYGKLVNQAGTEITAAALAGGEYVCLDPDALYGTRFIKVRSGTNGTPVNQGADRTLRLVARRRDV